MEQLYVRYSGDTIGSSGCATTSIAMAMTPIVTNLDTGVLNDYLKNNGAALSDFHYLDPWNLTAQFRYIGDGWVSSSSVIHRYIYTILIAKKGGGEFNLIFRN